MYTNAQNMWQRLECLGEDVKINVYDCNTSLVTFTINMTVSVYSKAVVLLYHSILNPPQLTLIPFMQLSPVPITVY